MGSNIMAKLETSTLAICSTCGNTIAHGQGFIIQGNVYLATDDVLIERPEIIGNVFPDPDKNSKISFDENAYHIVCLNKILHGNIPK